MESHAFVVGLIVGILATVTMDVVAMMALSIGIVLTLVYLGLLVAVHATPTALNAILYGTATTVLPWFLMFPSQGMGWLGLDAPGDAHLARASLFNHIIFGVGIALWIAVIRP